MAGANASVQVFEEFEGLVSEKWLREVVARTLELERGRASEAVSIIVADDDTVRDLNRRHRGLDETTDVLSFSFEHEGEYYGEEEPEARLSQDVDFVMPPGESLGLGEVIISYPQVVRQAQERGRPVDHELAHMLAHGILHLLGYDHMEPDEEASMKAQEYRVLAQVIGDE